MSHDTTSTSSEKQTSKGGSPQPDYTPFASYVRLFSYTYSTERVLNSIALVAALGSGVALALVNLIFGGLITILNDFVSGQATADGFRREVSQSALYFVYIGIARLLLTYVYASLTTIVSHRVVTHLRTHFLESALRQEIAFYDHGSAGSISQQATSNGTLIQGGIAEKLGSVFQSLAAFISAFALAFATQWKLTLIISSVVPVMLIAMGVVSALEAALETKQLACFAEAGSFAEGILSSICTIHALDIRSRLVARYDEHLKAALSIGRKEDSLFGCFFSIEYILMICGFSLAFWRGTHMLASGEISDVGDIFTAAAAASELYRVIDRPSQIDALSTTGHRPTEVYGEIEVDGVDFAYPTRPDTRVLEDLTLKIPAGKVTALVGASGSGKSTIIELVERWYNPTFGAIKLDGFKLDSLNLSWLRSTVRLVQQEPVLFSGTVFDNIASGLVGTPWEHEGADQKMARVVHAARLAFADGFIQELSSGYHTDVGQRGSLLSGGQKQRVGIARSVISEPKVLLLDEATSALDPHAEEVVQKALDNASRNRTTITIAHKMSTIRNADNIVVMSKGQIIEQGTHDELLKHDDEYARLVKIQDLTTSQSEDSTGVDSDAEDASPELIREKSKLSRLPTKEESGDIEALPVRDDYQQHKQVGLTSAGAHVIKDTMIIKWWYFLMIVGCLAAGAAYPAQAFLFAALVEAFELTGSALASRGDFLALMAFVVAIGVGAIYFTLGWTTNVIAQALNHHYRKRLLERFLLQDIQFFDRPENMTGALVSRLASQPQSVTELMGMNFALICLSLVNVVACSIISLVYSWKLGLVIVLGGLPPLLAAGYLKIRLESRLDHITEQRFTASASLASEAVTAIRTVSSLTMETSVLAQYRTELHLALKKSTKSILVMMPLFALTQSIEYFFLALGFWYGCRLISFGELSLFNFFVSFIGVFFAGQSAALCFSFSTSITKAKDAVNYIMWMQQLEPLIKENPDHDSLEPKNNVEQIEFRNTQFSYPLRPRTRVLKGIDLNVHKGQFIALVGASGCGKSTIIALLERFYDPTSGTISINGTPLSRLSPSNYRQNVALVQQEPTLYSLTVRDNIAYGSTEEVSDAEIEQACRAANAADFVSSLPEGLATQCGTNGSQFSGGQRQRLAIARSLVRDPKVLLLDEATSALDTASEKIVQRAIEEAARESDRITVAVAHRLSTVRDAYAIYVFSGGCIAESGTHEELLRRGRLYPQMCKSQNVA